MGQHLLRRIRLDQNIVCARIEKFAVTAVVDKGIGNDKDIGFGRIGFDPAESLQSLFERRIAFRHENGIASRKESALNIFQIRFHFDAVGFAFENHAIGVEKVSQRVNKKNPNYRGSHSFSPPEVR